MLLLVSIAQLGDERKNYIKMKAQSLTFIGVISWLLIEMARNIYINTWTDGPYGGINPFSSLIAISVIYLISLLFFKKKYGG
ncbi:hypothetical protein JNUCC74_11525 [Cerasibacillus sp. JNUCC 74]